MSSETSRLDALCEKYREMVRLRRPEGSGDGEPRSRLRALAARFPGALRELHDWPLAALEARLAALEAARAGVGDEPAWAALQWSFHCALRAALLEKRSPRVPARRIRGEKLVPSVLAQVAALHETTPARVAEAAFLRPP